MSVGKAFSEEELRWAAKAKVAHIFNLDASQLDLNAVFGEDLISTRTSDFRENEYDKLDHDIRDVADRSIRKELGSGKLIIRTVGDYCEHMVRCYGVKPKEVIYVLGLE